jgi:hypothetical protein
VNSPLQILKADRLALVVERDDLTIDHDGRLQPPGPLPQRLCNLRELAGFFVAEPRPQANGPVRLDLDDGADPVVFRFVDELGILERRVREGREHGTEHG